MQDYYVRTRRPYYLDSVGDIVGHGVIAGLIGGVVFGALQVLLAYLTGESLWRWFRLAAAIVFGGGSLPANRSLSTALIVGGIIHFVVAIVAALIFVAFLAALPPLARSTLPLIIAGLVFGVAVWYVNFHLIAPTWFSYFNQPRTMLRWYVQAPAHAILYGLPVALYVLAARPKREMV